MRWAVVAVWLAGWPRAPAIGHATDPRAQSCSLLDSSPAAWPLASWDAPVNPPGHCRGWRLLEAHLGVRVVASGSDGTRSARVGERSEIMELVSCGAAGAPAHLNLSDLSVYVELVSSSDRDAVLAEGSLPLAIHWTPRRAGRYALAARLHFANDGCDASAAPVYLGPSEPRCSDCSADLPTFVVGK